MAPTTLRGGHRFVRVGLTLGLLTVAACAPSPSGPVDGGRPDPAGYAREVVAATNEARAGLGLAPLERSRCAADAARERAADLVGEELEHRSLTGVAQTCAPGARVAENLVNSPATPPEVVDAWMASSGHRNNIVDPGLRRVGVGCVESPEGMLCSQVFLAR